MLVCPRREVKRFVDLTADEISDLWLSAQKVGSQLEHYHKASSLTFTIQVRQLLVALVHLFVFEYYLFFLFHVSFDSVGFLQHNVSECLTVHSAHHFVLIKNCETCILVLTIMFSSCGLNRIIPPLDFFSFFCLLKKFT